MQFPDEVLAGLDGFRVDDAGKLDDTGSKPVPGCRHDH
jgi:hypothetical protein